MIEQSNQQFCSTMTAKTPTRKYKTDLRKLVPSPQHNPLVVPHDIKTKRGRVRSGIPPEPMMNTKTGEIIAETAIHSVTELDDHEFVKLFADGIIKAFELNKTAQRVFQLVLREYERTPMTGGYADSVNLYWFGNGIKGEDADMSQFTFNRGLRDLLDKKFLYPKTPNEYWINPALFFKGDRITLIKEYRRKTRFKSINNDINTITENTEQ